MSSTTRNNRLGDVCSGHRTRLFRSKVHGNTGLVAALELLINAFCGLLRVDKLRVLLMSA